MVCAPIEDDWVEILCSNLYDYIDTLVQTADTLDKIGNRDTAEALRRVADDLRAFLGEGD